MQNLKRYEVQYEINWPIVFTNSIFLTMPSIIIIINTFKVDNYDFLTFFGVFGLSATAALMGGLIIHLLTRKGYVEI